MNIDKDFPTGLIVKHKESGKVGTVQAKFDGPPSCHDPWEVPVRWRGDGYTSGVNYASLIRV